MSIEFHSNKMKSKTHLLQSFLSIENNNNNENRNLTKKNVIRYKKAEMISTPQKTLFSYSTINNNNITEESKNNSTVVDENDNNNNNNKIENEIIHNALQSFQEERYSECIKIITDLKKNKDQFCFKKHIYLYYFYFKSLMFLEQYLEVKTILRQWKSEISNSIRIINKNKNENWINEEINILQNNNNNSEIINAIKKEYFRENDSTKTEHNNIFFELFLFYGIIQFYVSTSFYLEIVKINNNNNNNLAEEHLSTALRILYYYFSQNNNNNFGDFLEIEIIRTVLKLISLRTENDENENNINNVRFRFLKEKISQNNNNNIPLDLVLDFSLREILIQNNNNINLLNSSLKILLLSKRLEYDQFLKNEFLKKDENNNNNKTSKSVLSPLVMGVINNNNNTKKQEENKKNSFHYYLTWEKAHVLSSSAMNKIYIHHILLLAIKCLENFVFYTIFQNPKIFDHSYLFSEVKDYLFIINDLLSRLDNHNKNKNNREALKIKIYFYYLLSLLFRESTIVENQWNKEGMDSFLFSFSNKNFNNNNNNQFLLCAEAIGTEIDRVLTLEIKDHLNNNNKEMMISYLHYFSHYYSIKSIFDAYANKTEKNNHHHIIKSLLFWFRAVQQENNNNESYSLSLFETDNNNNVEILFDKTTISLLLKQNVYKCVSLYTFLAQQQHPTQALQVFKRLYQLLSDNNNNVLMYKYFVKLLFVKALIRNREGGGAWQAAQSLLEQLKNFENRDENNNNNKILHGYYFLEFTTTRIGFLLSPLFIGEEKVIPFSLENNENNINYYFEVLKGETLSVVAELTLLQCWNHNNINNNNNNNGVLASCAYQNVLHYYQQCEEETQSKNKNSRNNYYSGVIFVSLLRLAVSLYLEKKDTLSLFYLSEAQHRLEHILSFNNNNGKKSVLLVHSFMERLRTLCVRSMKRNHN